VTAVASYESRAFLHFLNLSCYSRGFQMDDTTAGLDVTTLCEKPKAFIVGQRSGSVSLNGPLDTDATANGFDDAMNDMRGGTYPFTYVPGPIAAGALVLMGNSIQTNLTRSATQTTSVDWSATATITGGVDAGAAIENDTTITVDTSGTAQNNGAATANGGVAHLHVSAFSGLTSDVITIEHSVNGSTSWATLVTFSTVTGLTSERVEVAAGTSVRQYLRVVDDVTGTGSITRFVAFSRR
jgi:hypothetical protein